MIVTPKTQQQHDMMAEFLRYYAGVQPSADLRCFGLVSEGKLVAVAALNGFMGQVAQAHIAYAPTWHFTPRQFAKDFFTFAFVTMKRQMLLGVVNSKNDRAMKMDLHLGFREVFRLPGMHDDGGDMVLLAMNREDCRYIDQVPVAAQAAGSES